MRTRRGRRNDNMESAKRYDTQRGKYAETACERHRTRAAAFEQAAQLVEHEGDQ